MKKSLILAGMLSIGYAYAQEGKVGVNTDAPKATMDIQPNANNAKVDATTNEGILAPRLSKVRVANISEPKQGTLVYVLDENSKENPDALISAYVAGTNTAVDNRVAKITEKGYYFYNGTEWVKTSATDGGEWKFDGVDAIVAKRANDTTAKDLIQIRNGKGLQQFIGSPDASTLTYVHNEANQLVNKTIFKAGADLKSVPNFNYITSDALSETSIFEEAHRPNNRIFTSDYKLFQFNPSHLDKVTTGQATYVPYYRTAYFNNLNKNIFDIWLNREQLYLGDTNSGTFESIGIYEGRAYVTGSNPVTNVRGIDSDLFLSGSNTITELNSSRSLLNNTYGFTGKISNVYGNRSLVNFQTGGEIQHISAYNSDITIPSTSNATSKYNYGVNSSISYLSQNTTKVEEIYSNKSYVLVNTAAATNNVQALNSTINAKSSVSTNLTSAWLSNIYENPDASAEKLQRMDGVVVSNNYNSAGAVKHYSGVVVHNKVSQEATGSISAINGLNIHNEVVEGTGSQITDNYGIYISDIKGATQNNHAIHTGAGKIKFGDLAQSGAGDRVVYADENGVLKTGVSAAANVKLATGTNAVCEEATSGTMNFGSVTINGDATEAFGFCMKNSTGEYKWFYIYGGAGVTTGDGGAFGAGL